MTYQEINRFIESIGLPSAYRAFPENNPENPAPPFIVWYFDESDDLMADNENYQQIRPLTIELYTDKKDFILEKAVETALKTGGFAYRRYENDLPSERMYMVTYETTAIITEEEN